MASAVQKNPHYTNMPLLWASITGSRDRYIQEDAEIHRSCCSGTGSQVFEQEPVHIQICAHFQVQLGSNQLIPKHYLKQDSGTLKDSESGINRNLDITYQQLRENKDSFHSCRTYKKHVSGKTNFGLIQKCSHTAYSTQEGKKTQKFLTLKQELFQFS